MIDSVRYTLVIVGSGASEKYRRYALESIARSYDVLLLDDSEATWQQTFIREHVVVHDFEVDQIDAAMQRWLGSYDLKGILTWDERRVQLVSDLTYRYNLPGNDPEVIRDCRDKFLSRQRFADHGVPSAQSSLVTTFEEASAAAAAIGWPVVLKPRALAGSIGVVKVAQLSELKDAWDTAHSATMPSAPSSGDVLVEEFLDGDEFSVECVSFDGRTEVVAVTRKTVGMAPFFEETGHVVDTRDLFEPWAVAISLCALQALEALGYRSGVSHVELKVSEKGPRLIEVNARLGGDLIPYLVKLATGVDLSMAAADICVGRAPDLRPRKAGAAGIRFFYPPTAGVFEGFEFDRPWQDEPWVDHVAWVTAVGSYMGLPPDAFMGRLGFVVVSGANRAECESHLDDVDESTRLIMTPRESARER